MARLIPDESVKLDLWQIRALTMLGGAMVFRMMVDIWLGSWLLAAFDFIVFVVLLWLTDSDKEKDNAPEADHPYDSGTCIERFEKGNNIR